MYTVLLLLYLPVLKVTHRAKERLHEEMAPIEQVCSCFFLTHVYIA